MQFIEILKKNTFVTLFSFLTLLIGQDAEAFFSEVSLKKGKDDLIYLTLKSKEQIAGLQFELSFDSKVFEIGDPILSTKNNDFSIKSNKDSSSIKVMAFSMEGKTFDVNDPILMIPLSSKGDYKGEFSIDVKDFILSKPNGNKISLRVSAGQIYVVPSIPSKFTLNQNYPNPFNDKTIIKFDLPESALVDLIIYDINGKRIKSIDEKTVLEAGFHSKSWDGLDDNGIKVPSGEYVCSLKVGVNFHAMKMVLLR
tara:strand:- start:12893 stop:13651 length:759 start_codon:yes stop_codon:yes gene_type:complete